jgi:hypothetical protein
LNCAKFWLYLPPIEIRSIIFYFKFNVSLHSNLFAQSNYVLQPRSGVFTGLLKKWFWSAKTLFLRFF